MTSARQFHSEDFCFYFYQALLALQAAGVDLLRYATIVPHLKPLQHVGQLKMRRFFPLNIATYRTTLVTFAVAFGDAWRRVSFCSYAPQLSSNPSRPRPTDVEPHGVNTLARNRPRDANTPTDLTTPSHSERLNLALKLTSAGPHCCLLIGRNTLLWLRGVGRSNSLCMVLRDKWTDGCAGWRDRGSRSPSGRRSVLRSESFEGFESAVAVAAQEPWARLQVAAVFLRWQNNAKSTLISCQMRVLQRTVQMRIVSALFFFFFLEEESRCTLDSKFGPWINPFWLPSFTHCD